MKETYSSDRQEGAKMLLKSSGFAFLHRVKLGNGLEVSGRRDLNKSLGLGTRLFVGNNFGHLFVGISDSILGGFDGSLGRFLGNLSFLGLLDGNFSGLNEALGMSDGRHLSGVALGGGVSDNSSGVVLFVLRIRLISERRSVFIGMRCGDNLEVFGFNVISDSGTTFLDDNSVSVGVVDNLGVASVVVMVLNSIFVCDSIETEILSVFNPVSLSGLGDILTGSVKGGVFVEFFGSGGHGLLVLFHFGFLKHLERFSVLDELGKNFLLELSSENGTDIGSSHNFASVFIKFRVEVIDNAIFVVFSLSSLELLEVLGSNGCEFLGFNLASDLEFTLETIFKFGLELGNLFVNDNKSGFTFLH